MKQAAIIMRPQAYRQLLRLYRRTVETWRGGWVARLKMRLMTGLRETDILNMEDVLKRVDGAGPLARIDIDADGNIWVLDPTEVDDGRND